MLRTTGPIKDELVRTGRLRGDVNNPDYDFSIPRLAGFYDGLTSVVNVRGWIHGLEAVTLQLSTAWHEVAVMRRLFPSLPGWAITGNAATDYPEEQSPAAEHRRRPVILFSDGPRLPGSPKKWKPREKGFSKSSSSSEMNSSSGTRRFSSMRSVSPVRNRQLD